LGDASVILVDNGSTDDSASGLSAWNEEQGFFDQVETLTEPRLANTEDYAWPKALLAGKNTLLLSAENLGFAAGNNLATRLALARGGEEVLLLNNDTTVATDFLVELRQGIASHPEAVLIPQIRLYHDPERIWNCGGLLIWPGRKAYFLENAPVARAAEMSGIPVSFVTGCALLYRPALTGLLTERFFFGEEDMEFSWRLRQMRLPALCINTSVIYHKVGQTLTSNYRKSEVFTLKRLVNLRLNLGGAAAFWGYLYYLANLLRLLIGRYHLSPLAAVRKVYRVARRSLNTEEVGGDLCVGYVQGEDHKL
jgi:GT2 family glycosyltransferase